MPAVGPEMRRQVLPAQLFCRFNLSFKQFGIYGEKFREATTWLGIREVLTKWQSPWQNPYVERLIGSIRRECLDYVIVLNETGFHRVLKSYFEYYELTRTLLSLEKDAPIPRRVQPPDLGKVVSLQVNSLSFHLVQKSPVRSLLDVVIFLLKTN